MPPEPAHDLAFGILEFLRVELGLEKRPGGAGELGDIRSVLFVPILFHKLPERMNGGVWDNEHEAGDIAEDEALLLGEARGQKRGEHEIIGAQARR